MLIDGRLPEANLKTEQERFPRADLHSAPGWLWASCSPVLRPVRGVLPLDWDRRRRVTPARTGSQEAWPGAESGGEGPDKSRGGTPTGERAPLSARRIR